MQCAGNSMIVFMFLMFVLFISHTRAGEGLSCNSCGDECTQSCGTRHFRTCCFNYLRKRSDPIMQQTDHQIVIENSQPTTKSLASIDHVVPMDSINERAFNFYAQLLLTYMKVFESRRAFEQVLRTERDALNNPTAPLGAEV